MRARMSDRTRETHQQRGYAPQSWAGDAALAEARAILAETEPVSRRLTPHAAFYGRLDSDRTSGEYTLRAALAESLRSFLEA